MSISASSIRGSKYLLESRTLCFFGISEERVDGKEVDEEEATLRESRGASKS